MNEYFVISRKPMLQIRIRPNPKYFVGSRSIILLVLTFVCHRQKVIKMCFCCICNYIFQNTTASLPSLFLDKDRKQGTIICMLILYCYTVHMSRHFTPSIVFRNVQPNSVRSGVTVLFHCFRPSEL